MARWNGIVQENGNGNVAKKFKKDRSLFKKKTTIGSERKH